LIILLFYTFSPNSNGPSGNTDDVLLRESENQLFYIQNLMQRLAANDTDDISPQFSREAETAHNDDNQRDT